MKHYIIIKFKENTEKEVIITPVRELFQKAIAIEGVKEVNIYESNVTLPNRYDLMIIMDLSKTALEEFDNSEIHKEWKECFGKYIEKKTIFDCD